MTAFKNKVYTIDPPQFMRVNKELFDNMVDDNPLHNLLNPRAQYVATQVHIIDGHRFYKLLDLEILIDSVILELPDSGGVN